jgi:hypothetical protein
MVDTNALLSYLRDHKIQILHLCKDTQINRQNFYCKCNTKREFTATDIFKISEYCKMTVEERDKIFFAPDVTPDAAEKK